MADINGTSGPDKVTVESGNTYRAGGGDDTIVLNGWSTGQGDEGNDTLIAGSGTSGFGPTVFYWSSRNNILVDLAAGYASDGWGGRDTLINIHNVHGFQRPGDVGYGSEQSDAFWLGDWNSGQGKIVIDGRAGLDKVSINVENIKKNGGGDLVLDVSSDGRIVQLHATNWPGLIYELHNVETVEKHSAGGGVNLDISSLIDVSHAGQELLLAGSRGWQKGAMGSAVTVSYSFLRKAPAQGAEGGVGFVEFNAAQQTLVREILAKLQQQTGLKFVEAVDDAGQIRFGINQQAATRGYSFLPGQPLNDPKDGDVWLDLETADVMQPGQEGYYVLLHELAHALGLVHPLSESDQSGAPVLLDRFANFGNTLMIDVHAKDASVWPSWYGAFDLDALRTLYGKKAYATGESTYLITAAQAQGGVVLMDDGGLDTLDISPTTSSAYIDLQPGRSSNVGLDAQGKSQFNNLSISTGSWIENLIATRFDDAVTANNLDNRITSMGGNDFIDGQGGRDTVVLPGRLADWVFERGDRPSVWFGANTTTRADSNQLTSVERLTFSDLQLALDCGNGERANQVARLLGVVFGADTVKNPEYTGAGLHLMDVNGYSYEALMQLALQARLGGSANDPRALVNLLFMNLAHITPTDEQEKPFVDMLNSRKESFTGLAIQAANTEINATNIGLAGIVDHGLIYVG